MSKLAADALKVERTEGEFPHAGRRSVRVACGGCCCTCCLTFVGAGIGGVAGLIAGIMRVVRVSRTVGGPLEGFVVGAGQILLGLITGVCIGAALGFLCDLIGFSTGLYGF